MDDLLIKLNGESILLDACGAAFSPSYSTLMFADLHLEKGSSYARGRQFLPPYDTADTLARMARAIARHKPARVIALGDSFHDGQAGERVAQQDRLLLESLGARTHFTWITGNHDPHPPGWLAGEVVESLRLGGLLLRHEPLDAFEPGEVAGHLHPCARVAKWEEFSVETAWMAISSVAFGMSVRWSRTIDSRKRRVMSMKDSPME